MNLSEIFTSLYRGKLKATYIYIGGGEEGGSNTLKGNRTFAIFL